MKSFDLIISHRSTFFDARVKAFAVISFLLASVGRCIYNYTATYVHANPQSLPTGRELSQFGHGFAFDSERSHDRHRAFVRAYIPSLSCSSVFSRLHNCVANTSVGLCMGGVQAIGMWQVSGSSFTKKKKNASYQHRLVGEISYQLRTGREKISRPCNRRND